MSGYELSFIDINGEDNSKLFFEKECDLLEWVKNSYCLSDEDVEHFRIVKYLSNVTHSFDISYKCVSEEDFYKNGDKVSVFGFIGEFIKAEDGKALVHFGGDALHFCQEWYDISDLTLI